MSQLPPQTAPYSMPPKPTSALAIVSLILGIISLIPCFGIGILPGIVAIILGVLALKAVNAGQAGGGGLAKTGMILGAVGIVIALVIFVGFYRAGSAIKQQVQQQMDQIKAQADKTAHDAQQTPPPTPPDSATPPTTPEPATPPATTPGAMLTPPSFQWRAELSGAGTA